MYDRIMKERGIVVGTLISGPVALRISKVTVLFDSPWRRLIEVEYTRVDTEQLYTVRSYTVLPDCVGAILVDRAPTKVGKASSVWVAVLEMYRPGAGGWGHEPPMVRVKENEGVAEAAVRALTTEIGLDASFVKGTTEIGLPLSTFPDGTTEWSRFVRVDLTKPAQDCYNFDNRTSKDVHDDALRWMTPRQLTHAIATRQIICPVSMEAFRTFMADERRRGRFESS